MRGLIGLGGVCALVGGALRVASAFIPYVAGDARLEALYGVIDVCLLFGTIAAYLSAHDVIGRGGLACFAIALAALASIVGPDATAFGVDFYELGAAVFAVSLAGFAVQLLRARAFMLAAALWIACAVLGVVATTGSALAFTSAGVALGLGFIATGVTILKAKRAPAFAGALIDPPIGLT